MANTDSFIDEVSEEVRRDRLFKLMRRWGWVPILLVVAIVGGAAYIEWQRAQDRAQAEAFGDALLTALDSADADARIAALEAIDVPSDEAGIILALMAAGEAANADDRAGAAARLRAAAENTEVARRYSDLALLKAEMLDPAPVDEARIVLEALAAPGAPYSALAEEQLALMEVRSGDLEAGLERLRAIERSAVATAGLQQRASQLIVALESGSVLVDAPAEEPLVEGETATEDAAPSPVDETGEETGNGTADETGDGPDASAAQDPDAEDPASGSDGEDGSEADDAEGAGADN